MRLRTYWITFLAFSIFQSLSIAFQINKHYVQLNYNVDDLFVGMMDVFYYVFFTIGALFYFSLVDRKNVTESYLKLSFLYTISGSFYAYFSVFDNGIIFINQQIDNLIKKFLLLASSSLFGLSEVTLWPMNLILVSQYFKPQSDGAMIGLWSSAEQFGSLVMFLFSSLLVYSVGVRWQVPVLLIAIGNMLSGLMIYFFLQNPKHKNMIELETINTNSEKYISLNPHDHSQKQAINTQQEQPQLEQITQKKFWKYTLELIKQRQLLVYFLANGITSGIFIGFMNWLPIYMTGIGWKSISGYITMVYEVTAIVGSLVIGLLHQQYSSQSETCTRLKQFFSKNSGFICTITTITAMIVWLIINQNILIYSILIGVSGFCMGGLYTSMHSNDLFSYTKDDTTKTQMFAVVIMITNYILCSIISLMMALAIQYCHSWSLVSLNESQYKGLVWVLLLMTIADLALLVVKNYYENPQSEQICKNDQVQTKN